jgi:hypothetical protein
LVNEISLYYDAWSKKHKILFLPYNKYTDFPVRQYGLGSRDVKNSKESTENAVSTVLEREALALLYLSLKKRQLML